ncbi:hypothetical protein [Burkholderia pseudomallei]|nr:hypothetical protein [Burkholderia pseudomallei]
MGRIRRREKGGDVRARGGWRRGKGMGEWRARVVDRRARRE